MHLHDRAGTLASMDIKLDTKSMYCKLILLAMQLLMNSSQVNKVSQRSHGKITFALINTRLDISY